MLKLVVVFDLSRKLKTDVNVPYPALSSYDLLHPNLKQHGQALKKVKGELPVTATRVI